MPLFLLPFIVTSFFIAFYFIETYRFICILSSVFCFCFLFSRISFFDLFDLTLWGRGVNGHRCGGFYYCYDDKLGSAGFHWVGGCLFHGIEGSGLVLSKREKVVRLTLPHITGFRVCFTSFSFVLLFAGAAGIVDYGKTVGDS